MKRFILTAISVLSMLTANAQGTGLSLQECLNMAMSNDAYLQNSKLDVVAAKEQLKEARWEYFPRVQATGFGFYSKDPLMEPTFRSTGLLDFMTEGEDPIMTREEFEDSMGEDLDKPLASFIKKGYTAGVSAIQPIYAGGRIMSGNKLAKLGVDAAILQNKRKADQTEAEIEDKYWLVVSLQEKVNTLNQGRELLDTLYKDAQSAIEAGVLAESEMMQLLVKKSELESLEIQLTNGIRLAKMDLFNAIGQEFSYQDSKPGVPDIDELYLSDGFDDIKDPYSLFVEESNAPRSAESQLLEIQVEAKELQKKMEVGKLLPTFAVGASFSNSQYNERVDPKNNMLGFVLVQIPITDLGKAEHMNRRYDIARTQAQNEKDYLDRQLDLQLRKFWLDLTSSFEDMKSADKAVDAANRTVDQLMRKYEAGMIPASEILKARLELRNLTDAQTEKRITYLKNLNIWKRRTKTD